MVQKCITERRGKLFCAFIYLCKAFDVFNRQKLFYVLIQRWVWGKMMNMLQNTYHSVQICTKIKFTVTNLGLHVCSIGCMFSPWHFCKIFINPLVNVFHITGERRIHFSNARRDITAGLFADDLVLVSDTIRGLQSKLNILQDFSSGTWI